MAPPVNTLVSSVSYSRRRSLSREERLRDRIAGGLMAIVRGLMMVACYSLSLALVRQLGFCPRGPQRPTTASPNFLGVSQTRRMDRLSRSVQSRVPWNGHSNDAVNVLVDSGASGHSFFKIIFPGLRDNLDNYKVMDVPRERLQPLERDICMVLHREFSVVTSLMIKENDAQFKLSCLIVPGLGCSLFSV